MSQLISSLNILSIRCRAFLWAGCIAVTATLFIQTNTPAMAAGAALIETALGYLLVEHPSIKAAGKTEESSRSSIGTAQAGYYPSINLTSDAGPQYIDNPTTRATSDRSAHERTKQVATLTISQNLFDGHLTTSGVRTAQLNTEAAGIELERTRQAVLFEGINA